MGIKMIYTEREKTDVTDINCIMCGECVRSCPEDNTLALAFAGKKFYTASRAGVMSGFEYGLQDVTSPYGEVLKSLKAATGSPDQRSGAEPEKEEVEQ